MKTDVAYILSYCKGELSPEECSAFEQELLFSPELQKEVESVRHFYRLTEQKRLQQDIRVDKNWQELKKRIDRSRWLHRAGQFVRSSAAVISIPLLLMSGFLFKQLNEHQNREVVERTVTSAYGLISEVTLPDGSLVILNSGSSLTYPEQFVDDVRSVTLDGEVYFKVKASPEEVFNVNLADGLQVSAYGTEFNINAYKEDKQIETVLVSGVVEVASTGDTKVQRALLQPEQMAIWVNATKQLQKYDDISIYAKTAWKDGKLVFRRAKMEEIARRLSRHFNVQITLEGEEIHQYEYSATFTAETLTEILSLLEKTAPIQCVQEEPEGQEDGSFSRRKIRIKQIDSY